MSRYDHTDVQDIMQAIVVQEFGRDDVDALDFLAHRSRADTTNLTETQQ